MMRRLPQDNSASALTTHQLQVERRESHRANQVALIYFTVEEEFYICHIHNYTQYKLTVKNVLQNLQDVTGIKFANKIL